MAATSGSFVAFVIGISMLATPPSSAFAAAAPRQPSAAQIQRALDRLAVVGNVLYVAAHPDDENTRLLAWLANDRRVRAAYLSLTRGEGGQNLIGREQGPLLGIIRTEELLAARSVDGAEQIFGRQRDFGYSKSPEETLAIWGKEAALADVVWAIRRFRPDVIVTRFSPDLRDTHGHHVASAQLALEAFRLAGDPKAFPEQLAVPGLAPWQPKRIVWNRFFWSGPPSLAEAAGLVKMDVGGYDPILGASYGELAAESRSMHKSQGFGANPTRGPAPEYFKLLAGEPMERSILDGIDTTWARVPKGATFSVKLATARAAFDPSDPAAAIPKLVEALAALEALPDNAFREDKRRELVAVIAACAGLHVEATAPESIAVPGRSLPVSVVVTNRSRAPVSLRAVRLVGGNASVEPPLPDRTSEPSDGLRTSRRAAPVDGTRGPLAANAPVTVEGRIDLPVDTALTAPVWLTRAPSPGRWDVAPQTLVGLPEAPPALRAEITVDIGGRALTIERPIVYQWLDQVAGQRQRAVEILPEITVAPASPSLVFGDARPRELRVVVRATSGAASGTLHPEAPAGWTIAPPSLPYSLDKKDAAQELVFRVTPPAGPLDEGASQTGAITFGGAASVVRVEHPHIPIRTWARPAEVKLVRLALKRGPVTTVGYIPGAGDDVAEALRNAGYEVTLLDDAALRKGDLRRFDAVVVGVRAYNVNPRLAGELRPALLGYVERGGTLVVQYNTNNRLAKLDLPIGPFPFSISQERVTDENAELRAVDPKHPALTTPNRLGARDFAGWVQERGLYFADKWDDRYAPVFAAHDPGEPDRKGGLLVAKHGKGIFVYTGLAFFRQLPEGVPGAYRLFANLLALGHGRK
jgi:LmbE family N-acetylglucosaminyl deacetylase